MPVAPYHAEFYDTLLLSSDADFFSLCLLLSHLRAEESGILSNAQAAYCSGFYRYLAGYWRENTDWD